MRYNHSVCVCVCMKGGGVGGGVSCREKWSKKRREADENTSYGDEIKSNKKKERGNGEKIMALLAVSSRRSWEEFRSLAARLGPLVFQLLAYCLILIRFQERYYDVGGISFSSLHALFSLLVPPPSSLVPISLPFDHLVYVHSGALLYLAHIFLTAWNSSSSGGRTTSFVEDQLTTTCS